MFKRFVLSLIGKLCIFFCFSLTLFSKNVFAESIIVKTTIYPTTEKCIIKVDHKDDMGKLHNIWSKGFKVKDYGQKLSLEKINGLTIDRKMVVFKAIYSMIWEICSLESELDSIMRWGEPGDSDAKYKSKIALEKSLITTLLGLSTL